jgi:hypothetical protein
VGIERMGFLHSTDVTVREGRGRITEGRKDYTVTPTGEGPNLSCRNY